jgi:hypothetical protein
MTDPESISGRSFPIWMKQKPDVNFDVDGNTFSPPAHEDQFFYIKYPNAENKTGNQSDVNVTSLTEALKNLNSKPLTASSSTSSAIQQDFSKQHTDSCKKFLSKVQKESSTNHFVEIKNPAKPFGTDDGFKGAGAACGSSIVKVARQMVSGKSLNRGFTVANFNADVEAPDNIIETPEKDFMSNSRYMVRRGSKSLPASPLSSPKSMRKANANPFFTGQFATNSNTGEKGWFLSGLLGIQRETTISTQSVVSNISEEAEEAIEVPKPANISSNKTPKPLQAKPSELR